MNLMNIIFLILLLVISIFMSNLIGFIFNLNVFNINEFGFQFLIFSILGSFIYFTLKYHKLINTIFVIIFFSIVFGYILNQTSMSKQVGGFMNLSLYILTLFIFFTIFFKFVWLNKKIQYLKDIYFSIIFSFFYTIIHIIMHQILKIDLTGKFVLRYFINSLMITLTISISFRIAEFMFSKIEKMLQTPDRITHYDDEE